MHLTVSSATLQSFSTSANALMDYFRGPQHALASFLHTIPPKYSQTPTHILLSFQCRIKVAIQCIFIRLRWQPVGPSRPITPYGPQLCQQLWWASHCEESIMIRDHSGHGLGQWEEALHSNASSHWLSPCPEWSLMIIMMRAASPHAWRCWAIGILKMGQYM